MITREEWDRLTPDDQYSYVLYLHGQLEGMVRSMYIVSPRRNTAIGPQETKEVQPIQTVEDWLKSDKNINNG